MLPSYARLRRSSEFAATVKSHARTGTKTVVVYARNIDPLADTQVGFVVSKAVGNAVTRNRVKRQLRHLSRARLESTPAGLQIVIRALPESAKRPARLLDDLDFAWKQTIEKVASR